MPGLVLSSGETARQIHIHVSYPPLQPNATICTKMMRIKYVVKDSNFLANIYMNTIFQLHYGKHTF